MASILRTQFTGWRYWGHQKFDVMFVLFLAVPILAAAFAYVIPQETLAVCRALPAGAALAIPPPEPNPDALGARYLWAAFFTVQIASTLAFLAYAAGLLRASLRGSALLLVVVVFVAASAGSVAIAYGGERGFQCVGGTVVASEPTIFETTIGKLPAKRTMVSDTGADTSLAQEKQTVFDAFSWQLRVNNALATASSVAIALAALTLAWRAARIGILQQRRPSRLLTRMTVASRRQFYILFVLASALVTFTTLSLRAWTDLPIPYLPDDLKNFYQSARDHYVIYNGFTFSLVLAGIFIPAGLKFGAHAVAARPAVSSHPHGVPAARTPDNTTEEDRSVIRLIQARLEGGLMRIVEIIIVLAPLAAAAITGDV